jgi:hypothetical protein
LRSARVSGRLPIYRTIGIIVHLLAFIPLDDIATIASGDRKISMKALAA